MIIRNRSFPHPVLAPFTDDVSPNVFDMTLNVSNDAEAFYLDIAFNYENSSLRALIAEGKAAHSVHIECKRNFYRELHTTPQSGGRIVINTNDLVGRVEISGFIVARAVVTAYQIAGSHSDYGTSTFSIQPGDVLAAGSTMTFDAYLDYDPLNQISSILTVRKSDDVIDGPMQLDTNGEQLIATLSRNDYDRYTDLKGDPSLAALLANQLVVPALMQAVHEIKEASEVDFEEEMSKRWFRSIVKKLSDGGIDIRASGTSPMHAVQNLLQLPLRRSLDRLARITALEESP